MTEPASPSGGDPGGPPVGSPEPAAPGTDAGTIRPPDPWAVSPWGAPSGPGPVHGAGIPPEAAPLGYAPPPTPGVGGAPSGGGPASAAPFDGGPPSSGGPFPGGPPAGPPSYPGSSPYPGPGGAYPGTVAAGSYPGQPAAGTGWPASSGHGPGPLPPPPPEAPRAPKRVDAVPGTPFGVVHLDVPAVTSGPAVGSLIAGIGSILVSFLVICFGVGGAQLGGAWAAGAFTVPGVLAGTAAIVAGLLARRQIRRAAPPPAVRFTGRGLATAGISCGGVGLVLSLLGLGLALLVQLA